MHRARSLFCHTFRYLGRVWLGTLLSFPLVCQPQPLDQLQSRLQEIYKEHAFEAKIFGPARWLGRGAEYAVFERSSGADGLDLVRYEPTKGKREVLIAADQLQDADGAPRVHLDRYAAYPDAPFALSRDMTRVLLLANAHVDGRVRMADYWLFDRQLGALEKVATDVEAPDTENAFSPDGFRVAYVRAHDIYVRDVRSGHTARLTTDGDVGRIGNGVGDWLSGVLRWSPDGTRIAYTRSDSSNVGLFPLLDNTKDAYPTAEYIRFPKVGTPIPTQRVGVVNATGGETRWIDIPGDPGSYYVDDVRWAESSRELVVQKLSRSRDRLDVYVIGIEKGVARLVHHDEDPSWVQDRFARDPGFGWINRGKAFTWLREANGWRHAYVVTSDGGGQTLLSPGDYDVMSRVAADARWLYYIASPHDATQSYLYRARLDGTGRAELVTPAHQRGTHSYDVSPDARWAFHTYSSADDPPVTELISLPSHRIVTVLEDNVQLRQRLVAWRRLPTEFLKLDIGGGVVMDAWMLRPGDFDATKKYPVFVFVYGEPASQTVVDSWGIGQRRHLFHRAIADAGYLVVSMDNRGTPAPKGSAWRRAVFGSLGPLSTEEQAAGLRELGRTRPYVDLSRVGIWGWSAGGTNTLNALFRKSDQYQVGIAVAPKPRPDLYNAWFQEAYMRTPATNPEGYRLAAPLNYAEGLKGDLLIVHGTGDDNSHLQITEHLVNRLIELGKPFDYMTYPNRSHAINEGAGTTLHLYSMIARYLTEHLPAGSRSRDSEAIARK